jgi:hypothetical protein
VGIVDHDRWSLGAMNSRMILTPTKPIVAMGATRVPVGEPFDALAPVLYHLLGEPDGLTTSLGYGYGEFSVAPYLSAQTAARRRPRPASSPTCVYCPVSTPRTARTSRAATTAGVPSTGSRSNRTPSHAGVGQLSIVFVNPICIHGCQVVPSAERSHIAVIE